VYSCQGIRATFLIEDGSVAVSQLAEPYNARRAIPIVSVRIRLPEAASASATIRTDLEIQFAGRTVQYKEVPFQLVTQGNQSRITGTIPAALSVFKIDPPSLLEIPIRNELPVRVDMTWRQQ
jgi:hypothetical protein